jgi:hypothetical protein
MKNHETEEQLAEDRFYSLLNQQDQPFRSNVKQRAEHLVDRISGDTGRCGNWFNEVLAGTSATLVLSAGVPPDLGTLPTLDSSPADAKETAAILCKISLAQALVKGEESSGSQRLGWNNLNEDAKGWCKNLLLMQGPNNATVDGLRDLLTAKSFAAILVDYLLPLAPRTIVELSRSIILQDTGGE